MSDQTFPHDIALRTWEHAGLTCIIGNGGSRAYINGYVQVPPDHPLYQVNYSRTYNLPIEVHGSLTYGSDNNGWFGFDTAHGNDSWTLGDLQRAGVVITDKIRSVVDTWPTFGEPHYWTVEQVVAETESLAEQLSKITQKPVPNAYEITDEELNELRAELDRARNLAALLESELAGGAA